MMKKVILVCGLILGLTTQSCTSKSDQNTEPVEAKKDQKESYLNPQTMEDEGMFAMINTNKGIINLVLEFQRTPMTVANFIGLADGSISNDEKAEGEAYYNGLNFHRVLKDFMIQGGCPQGTGGGDPGYKFADEFHADLKHDGPGILSMANSGPTTNGSQFFITHKETPWLDGKHTIFGHVLDSLSQDVVNAIENGDQMISVEIVRKGKLAKKFKAAAIFVEGQENAKRLAEEKAAAQKVVLEELTAGAEETLSGLQYIITKEGNGVKPQASEMVSVHYEGRLVDGTVFDSSYKRNDPIKFPLGVGKVIKGWDEGVALLSVGGKATFIIPSHLAYGDKGAGGVIPPNATLVFDVELVEIVK